MQLNLHAVPLVRAAFALLLWPPTAVDAQAPCPSSGSVALERAWRAYRADSLQVALKQFEQAHRICPENLDAKVGVGLALLRSGRVAPADSVFLTVLTRSATNSDAWEGRTRTALLLGDSAAAIELPIGTGHQLQPGGVQRLSSW
jgi:hypothetical protein